MHRVKKAVHQVVAARVFRVVLAQVAQVQGIRI
jgi:hypothetical protein